MKRKTKNKSPKYPLPRPKNLKHGDVIEIEWDDHWTGSGWRGKDVVAKSEPVLCRSVGYFSGFSPKGDIIVSGSHGEDDFNGVMYRLWGAVKKIRKLR